MRYHSPRRVLAVFIVSLVAGSAVESAEPLKKKQGKNDQYDQLVDAFILWDVGQLRGPVGEQARQQFTGLSDERAIPALVRGVNKSARIQASCPIMVVSAKLRTLIEATDDRELLRGVIKNLDSQGGGVFYGSYVESVRQIAEQRLYVVDGSPPKSSALLQGGGTTSQLRRSRMPIEKWTLQDLTDAVAEDKGPELVKALEEIKNRPGGEYTALLAQAVNDLDGEMKLVARGLLAQRMVRMTDATLQNKIQDKEGEVRAAAALAIGYKESPLLAELAEALADSNPLVAVNAHLSIVKLSGEDFGPKEGDSLPERFAASQRWKKWLETRK